MRIRAMLVIAYVVSLLMLAFSPPLPFRLQPEGTAWKLHHVAAFAVLTVLTHLVLRPRSRPGVGSLAAAAAAAFLFGVFVEWVQTFLPYRSGQARDLLSNALGIGIGVVFALLVNWARTRSRKHTSR